MIVDFIAVQAKRQLQTLNMEVPDDDTIEEIISVVIDSPYVISHEEHDKTVDGLLSDDSSYDEGYLDGYAAALADVRELKNSANADHQPGPSCA
jgi:hypothetical protein